MQLKPHQRKVVDAFQRAKHQGILVYHGLGSGKTITAIACGETLPKLKKTVVVPASLQDNFRKELAKVGAPLAKYDILSYEMFAKRAQPLDGGVVIFDEAHRLRNASAKIAAACIRNAKDAQRVVLLTGTPVVNHPTDIIPLFNLVQPGALPGPTRFEETFVEVAALQQQVPVKVLGLTLYKQGVPVREKRFKNRDQLVGALRGLVSYYSGRENAADDYPRSTEHYHHIAMDPQQERLHIKAAKEALTAKELAVMKGGYVVDLEGASSTAKRLNTFLNKTRQIVNVSPNAHELSRKMRAIAATVRRDPLPAVIYSNFKSAGVSRLADELKRTHRVGLFTGEESKTAKQQLVAAYNGGQLDVLLITASGSEGLDLKRTRQMHVMEPHWNVARLNQAIGRAIRFQSHADLPHAERHVDVHHWVSVFEPRQGLRRLFAGPDAKFRTSSDEYLLKLSKNKARLNAEFLGALQEASI